MLDTLPPRIASKIDFAGPCWLWTGQINHRWGYGYCWWEGSKRRAHRLIWTLLVGPIPDGMQLDHLCRVRHCVNPDHLEVVTAKENLRRGPTVVSTIAATRTHCPQGHPYDEANTRYEKDGSRKCVICRRRRDNARYASLTAEQKVERNCYNREWYAKRMAGRSDVHLRDETKVEDDRDVDPPPRRSL
jgi:hypothetical protein